MAAHSGGSVAGRVGGGDLTIRVLLAEDQALVRAGFRGLLEGSDDVEVVGEVANGADAVNAARTARPDIVLMDVRMPIMDGLEAIRRIAADELEEHCRHTAKP